MESGQVRSSFPLKPPCKMSVAVEEAVLPSISTFAGLVPLENGQPEMVRVLAQGTCLGKQPRCPSARGDEGLRLTLKL